MELFETSSEILESTKNEQLNEEIPRENSNADTSYLEETKKIDIFFSDRINSKKNVIKVPVIQQKSNIQTKKYYKEIEIRRSFKETENQTGSQYLLAQINPRNIRSVSNQKDSDFNMSTALPTTATGRLIRLNSYEQINKYNEANQQISENQLFSNQFLNSQKKILRGKLFINTQTGQYEENFPKVNFFNLKNTTQRRDSTKHSLSLFETQTSKKIPPKIDFSKALIFEDNNKNVQNLRYCLGDQKYQLRLTKADMADQAKYGTTLYSGNSFFADTLTSLNKQSKLDSSRNKAKQYFNAGKESSDLSEKSKKKVKEMIYPITEDFLMKSQNDFLKTSAKKIIFNKQAIDQKQLDFKQQSRISNYFKSQQPREEQVVREIEIQKEQRKKLRNQNFVKSLQAFKTFQKSINGNTESIETEINQVKEKIRSSREHKYLLFPMDHHKKLKNDKQFFSELEKLKKIRNIRQKQQEQVESPQIIEPIADQQKLSGDQIQFAHLVQLKLQKYILRTDQQSWDEIEPLYKNQYAEIFIKRRLQYLAKSIFNEIQQDVEQLDKIDTKDEFVKQIKLIFPEIKLQHKENEVYSDQTLDEKVKQIIKILSKEPYNLQCLSKIKAHFLKKLTGFEIKEESVALIQKLKQSLKIKTKTVEFMINVKKNDVIKNATKFIDKFIQDKKFKIAQQKQKQKQMISRAFEQLQAQQNAKKYADGLEESQDQIFEKQLERQILGKILKIKFKNHLFQEFKQQHSLFEIQDPTVRQTSPKTRQIISNLLVHIEDQSQKYADQTFLVPIITELDHSSDLIEETDFFCKNKVLISNLFDALLKIMPSEDLNLSEQYIIADKNIFVNETEVRIKKQILRNKFDQEKLDFYNNLIRFYKPINNKVDKVNTLNLIFEKDVAWENFKEFNKKQGAILYQDADPSFQLINQFLLGKNEKQLTNNRIPNQYKISQGKLLLFDLELSPIDIKNLAEFLDKAGDQSIKSLHLQQLIIHKTFTDDQKLAQILSSVRQHRNTIQELHLSKVNFGVKSQLIFLDIVDVLQSLVIDGLITKTIRKAKNISTRKPQSDSDSYDQEEEDYQPEITQDSSQALVLKAILEYSRRLQILKITNIDMNSAVPLINKIILKMPFIGELDLSSTFLSCQSLAQISNQLKRNAGGLYLRYLSLANNKLNFDISSFSLNQLSNQKYRLLNQQISYKKQKQNVLKANPKVLASIQFLTNLTVFATNCKTLIHLDISSMGLGKCTQTNLLNTQTVNVNLDLKQVLERLMDTLSCKNTNLLAIHLSDNDFQNFHYQQSENILRSFTHQFQEKLDQVHEEFDFNSTLREIVSQFQKMKQESVDKKSTDEYFEWFIKCKEIKYERQKIQTFSEITFVNKDLTSFLNQDGFIKPSNTIYDHSLMLRPFLDHPELFLFQKNLNQNIDGWIENKSLADTCLFCHKHRYTLIFFQPNLENQASNGDLLEIQNKILETKFYELNSKLGQTNSPIILGSLFNQPITRMVRVDIFTLMMISKNKMFVENEDNSKKLIETILSFSKYRFKEEDLKQVKEKLKGWNRILFDFINYNNYVDVLAINQPQNLPELDESSQNSQYYVAAAYVPPGKHAFIIYDPLTKKIFQKEIIVLPTTKDTYSNTNFIRNQVQNKINVWGPRQMIENDPNKWLQAWEAIISTISQEVECFTKKASPNLLIKILQKEFQKLTQIFTFYSANSLTYPLIDWQSFLLAIKSLEKDIESLGVSQLSIAQIEILFISSAQTRDGYHQITNLNFSLSRLQFIQAIIKWLGTIFRQLNIKPEFEVFFEDFIQRVCNQTAEKDNIYNVRAQIQQEKQINDVLLDNFQQIKGLLTYYSINFFKIINKLNNEIQDLEEAKALREEEEAAQEVVLDENAEKKKPKEIKKRKAEEEIDQKYKFENVTDFLFLILKQLLPNMKLSPKDIQTQLAYSKISVFESSILQSQKFKKLTLEEFLEFLCRIYLLKNKNKFIKKTFNNLITQLHQAHYDLNIYVKPIPFSVLKKQKEEEEKQAAIQAMQSKGRKKKKNKEQKKANFPTPFLDEEVKQIQELYQKANLQNK